MTILYRPSQPIEKYIPITAYEGAFGERWEKTKKNAVQIANDLVSKYKYSKEIIVSQLDRAIRRINRNQALAGAVFATDIAIPVLCCSAHYSPRSPLEWIAIFIPLALSGMLAAGYIRESDWHKVLYQEIQRKSARESLEEIMSNKES